MIVIITSKNDSHVGPVTRHIDSAKVPWIRLNTEDAATNLELRIVPGTGTGTIKIRDSGRVISLKDVQAVWYRKPQPVDVSHLGLVGGARDYVEAEFREILDGVYALLRCVPWINDPFRTRIAHRKLAQLEVAAGLGFITPRTLVTNDANAALQFADSVGGDLAIKSLGSLSVLDDTGENLVQYGIFTRRVSTKELQVVQHTIANLATVFQEFVPKQYELRVTCIGAHVFACRIEARTEDLTADDYRFDTNQLQHSAFECTSDLKDRLRAYMHTFGLHFAAFDLIVRPSGEIVFLECNPNGQWLWVEEFTGLPIGKAIADHLLGSRQEQATLAHD